MNDKPSTAAPSVAVQAGKFQSPFFVWPAVLALAGLLYFGISYLADVFTH